jgi:hypothetical protein
MERGRKKPRAEDVDPREKRAGDVPFDPGAVPAYPCAESPFFGAFHTLLPLLPAGSEQMDSAASELLPSFTWGKKPRMIPRTRTR